MFFPLHQEALEDEQLPAAKRPRVEKATAATPPPSSSLNSDSLSGRSGAVAEPGPEKPTPHRSNKRPRDADDEEDHRSPINNSEKRVKHEAVPPPESPSRPEKSENVTALQLPPISENDWLDVPEPLPDETANLLQSKFLDEAVDLPPFEKTSDGADICIEMKSLLRIRPEADDASASFSEVTTHRLWKLRWSFLVVCSRTVKFQPQLLKA